MTQLVREIQTNFTSGVADPKLIAREDIVYYYNALADANNLLALPQGGVTRRPGKQFVRKLSPVLSAVSLSGATATAPQGGTAAHVKDGDETTLVTTTNNLSTTNPFVVAELDLGTAQAITAVDVINFSVSSGTLTDQFFVQYSNDNSTWANYGTPIDIDTTLRSRRRRNETGPITARYWRFARIGATSLAATVSVAEMRLWAESNTLSAGRLFPFAYSTSQAYMHVISDGNIDVLKGTGYETSCAIPTLSADLAITNYTQSIDTMLTFHTSYAPWRIFWQGDDDEFDFRKQPFTNVPQYDYGAGTGGVDEVQTLNVSGTTSGDLFTLEFEGYATTAIAVGASTSATAANIQAALRALGNVNGDTGLTVLDVTNGFTVTFSGDALGHMPHVEIQIFVLKGNGVWDVARTTRGVFEGEDIMSDARGWPRCGTFYQSRTHLCGFEGVPDAWIASVIDDRFNFNTTIDDATKALQFRAETDQVSAIYQVVPGRFLTFFTNDSEFYNPTEPVSDSAVMKLTTKTGSKEGLRVYEVDGALIFIQGAEDADGNQIGTSVHEFIFDELQQSYQSNELSKLSSSLIKNPVDMALRKALSTEEADILLMPNDDGTATSFTLLRNDDVKAFMPLSTRDGDKILAVGVDKRQRVYWITERIINGAAVHYVELWNTDLLLDCGSIVTITAETTTATAAQAAYTWTFANPLSADAIGVRLNGGRLASSDYEVDLGSKTVTLGTAIAATVAAGDEVRVACMVKTVTGADYLEGETLQTYIDGSEGEDVTVSGGSFTLTDYADTEIQYGFDFDVSGKMMPLRVPGAQTLVGKKVRVVNAYIELYQTGNLEILANDGNWTEVELQQFDTLVLDRSLDELLFTGNMKIDGLPGYEIGGVFEFRQPGPAPFTLLAITREVSL